MCWTLRTYVRKIYIELGLELVGWPPSLPFTNPSNPELTGRERIALLLSLWESIGCPILCLGTPPRSSWMCLYIYSNAVPR